MSRSLLSRIMSIWKARGMVRTLSAMACYIPSFTKFHAHIHAISHNFHAIWAISAIFGPISTCWVSKSKYWSLEIRGDTFTQFHALLHAISRKFQAIFMQFRLFQPFVGQFQQVWYQKAST